VVAELALHYLRSLAAASRFSSSGHVAIFDQTGRLVAHPRYEWQTGAHDVSHHVPVSLALIGDTGVSRYRPPSGANEMIAGTAVIPIADWGIAVQQHVSEVLARSAQSRDSIVTVAQITLALVLLGSILFSHILSTPLEQLITALKSAGRGQMPSISGRGKLRFLTSEHKQLEQAFDQMVSDLKSSRGKLLELAYYDPVTGLPNRSAFQKTVESCSETLARRNIGGALVFMEIENFKEINEAHGHYNGDQVLRCIAGRMSGIIEAETGHSPTSVPETQQDVDHDSLALHPYLARFGGNEFVLFLHEGIGFAHLDRMLELILDAVSTKIPGLNPGIELSASAGIASYPEHGLTFAELIKRADIAMHHARKSGTSKIRRYGDGTGDVSVAELRRDVLQAIRQDQLELYYQPKVNARSNDIEGVEALVRWIHPVKGVISPADVIPAIENTLSLIHI